MHLGGELHLTNLFTQNILEQTIYYPNLDTTVELRIKPMG